MDCLFNKSCSHPLCSLTKQMLLVVCLTLGWASSLPGCVFFEIFSILPSLGITSFCTQSVSIPANNRNSVFPCVINTHLQVPGKIARGEWRRPEQITTGNAWLYLWILFSCYSAIPCISHSLMLFKTGENSMRQKDNGKCLTALVIEAWYSLIQISSDLFALYLNYNLICFFRRLRLWKRYCWMGCFFS